MATLSDIPERDGEDGATQLAKLRSYLKDGSTPYTYDDLMLIGFLIENTAVSVWQLLRGVPSNKSPFTLDLKSNPQVYNIRFASDDTDELALKRTDYEIEKLLQVFPSRYLIDLLSYEDNDTKTMPYDIYHPIYIYRNYLSEDIADSGSLSDYGIAARLLESYRDPFAYILDKMDRGVGASITQTASAGSSALASVEGITFAKAEEQQQTTMFNRDTIFQQYVSSPYVKNDIIGVYDENGENTTLDNGDWYGV